MKPATTNELCERARTLYRHAGPAMDTATAARLRAARQAALQQSGPIHRLRHWMMPAGAFAVTALAVVMVWQPLRRTPTPTLAPTTAAVTQTSSAGTDSTDNELPPDADSADPALYQNLDFYAWLAQQPSTQHPQGG